MLPGDGFLGPERAAEHGLHAEHLEERRRDRAGRQPDRLTGAREIGVHVGHRGDPVEGAVHLRPVEEVGRGDHVVEDAFGQPLLEDITSLSGSA